MKIINNPILGRNFRLSSLILNETGLHRLVVVENKKHTIFLTDDVEKIMELMGINFPDIDKKPIEEAFPVLLKSEYFHPYVFQTDRVEYSNAIIEFKAWLNTIGEVPVRTHNPIRTERIEEILSISIKPQIDKAKFVLEQFDKVKSKFQGKKLLPYLGDYSPRNFSTDFPNFTNSFESDYSFMEFIVDNTVEDIAKKFKEVNNIK